MLSLTEISTTALGTNLDLAILTDRKVTGLLASSTVFRTRVRLVDMKVKSPSDWFCSPPRFFVASLRMGRVLPPAVVSVGESSSFALPSLLAPEVTAVPFRLTLSLLLLSVISNGVGSMNGINVISCGLLLTGFAANKSSDIGRICATREYERCGDVEDGGRFTAGKRNPNRNECGPAFKSGCVLVKV